MVIEVLLNAVAPSVTFFIIMQSIKLSAVMLSVIILSVIMLSVVMLSVVMLSVVAPSNRFKKGLEFETKFCLSHPKTFFPTFVQQFIIIFPAQKQKVFDLSCEQTLAGGLIAVQLYFLI
jgi:hypothetical protein